MALDYDCQRRHPPLNARSLILVVLERSLFGHVPKASRSWGPHSLIIRVLVLVLVLVVVLVLEESEVHRSARLLVRAQKEIVQALPESTIVHLEGGVAAQAIIIHGHYIRVFSVIGYAGSIVRLCATVGCMNQ